MCVAAVNSHSSLGNQGLPTTYISMQINEMLNTCVSITNMYIHAYVGRDSSYRQLTCRDRKIVRRRRRSKTRKPRINDKYEYKGDDGWF